MRRAPVPPRPTGTRYAWRTRTIKTEAPQGLVGEGVGAKLSFWCPRTGTILRRPLVISGASPFCKQYRTRRKFSLQRNPQPQSPRVTQPPHHNISVTQPPHHRAPTSQHQCHTASASHSTNVTQPPRHQSQTKACQTSQSITGETVRLLSQTTTFIPRRLTVPLSQEILTAGRCVPGMFANETLQPIPKEAMQ